MADTGTTSFAVTEKLAEASPHVDDAQIAAKRKPFWKRTTKEQSNDAAVDKNDAKDDVPVGKTDAPLSPVPFFSLFRFVRSIVCRFNGR
jgi:hypothetical protein